MIIFLPINFRIIALISIALICVLVYLSFIQESNPKEKYTAITGSITLLDKKYHQLPLRDAGKFRYLKLNASLYIFELFIGTDPGDFSPKLNRIDELKQGDEVTIYEYESNNVNRDYINRGVMFIEKDGIDYFEKGNSKKLLGIIMIAICVGLFLFSFIMWKKGKIRF